MHAEPIFFSEDVVVLDTGVGYHDPHGDVLPVLQEGLIGRFLRVLFCRRGPVGQLAEINGDVYRSLEPKLVSPDCQGA